MIKFLNKPTIKIHIRKTNQKTFALEILALKNLIYKQPCKCSLALLLTSYKCYLVQMQTKAIFKPLILPLSYHARPLAIISRLIA